MRSFTRRGVLLGSSALAAGPVFQIMALVLSAEIIASARMPGPLEVALK